MKSKNSKKMKQLKETKKGFRMKNESKFKLNGAAGEIVDDRPFCSLFIPLSLVTTLSQIYASP